MCKTQNEYITIPMEKIWVQYITANFNPYKNRLIVYRNSNIWIREHSLIILFVDDKNNMHHVKTAVNESLPITRHQNINNFFVYGKYKDIIKFKLKF